jgi:signal peptidase I
LRWLLGGNESTLTFDQTMRLRQTTMLIAAAVLLSSCDRARIEVDFVSGAMEPTIKSGSKVIVDTQSYDHKDPERFDLVVFTPPHSPESQFAFTLVGLPGETIKLDDRGLRIDGSEIKHPNKIDYIAAEENKNMAPDKGIEVRNEASLGPDQYFVLGDNTANALDSRYFGPIRKHAILGKIIIIEQVEDADAE